MRRKQVFELEDFAWCPAPVRDGGTDWLAFMAGVTGAFDVIAPKLRDAMRRTGTDEVVDLCSGGGGPWPTLSRTLAATGPVRVLLTDLFPNLEAFAHAERGSEDRITHVATPTDATDVPAELRGVRTMFNGFHHFPPHAARAILADAVKKQRAIAIFEGVDRRFLPLALMPLQAVMVLLLTPCIRPFRWTRLLFTYLVPLIPFVVFFDGTMSMLRIYLPDELHELIRTVPGHEDYDWDVGITPLRGMPGGITHLVGTPRATP